MFNLNLNRLVWLVTLALGFALDASAGQLRNTNPESRFTFFMHAGAVRSKVATGGLRRDGPTLGLNGGFTYCMSPNWSFDLDAFTAFGQYKGPPIAATEFLSSWDSERSSSTFGVTGWLRATRQIGWFAPYARLGLGIHHVSLKVHGTQLLFFPTSRESSSVLGAPAVAAGANLWVSDGAYLSVEGRYLAMSSRFGSLSPGKVELGGPTILVGVGVVH